MTPNSLGITPPHPSQYSSVVSMIENDIIFAKRKDPNSRRNDLLTSGDIGYSTLHIYESKDGLFYKIYYNHHAHFSLGILRTRVMPVLDFLERNSRR